jgi:hypothetical protein
MNNYVSLKIGDLLLAIPGYEIAQINLSSDIQIQSGVACVSYQSDLIPVIRFNEELADVQQGSEAFPAKYVVTLIYPDEDFKTHARLALQVDLASKVSIIKNGSVPQTMKLAKSPILGWFEDSRNQRGFLTQTAAIESFVNHATQVKPNAENSTLAG